MDASPAQELSLRRHLLGVALILAVVTLWVGASFLMKVRRWLCAQHYAKLMQKVRTCATP